MRRVTCKSHPISRSVPRLRPHPLIDERTIREVRIMTVQYPIDPPAHGPIPARRAGARSHVHLDLVPRARINGSSGYIGVAMILVGCAETLIQIIWELSRPIQELGLSRIAAEIEHAVLATLRAADKEGLVCVDQVSGKFRVGPPPKSDVNLFYAGWCYIV